MKILCLLFFLKTFLFADYPCGKLEKNPIEEYRKLLLIDESKNFCSAAGSFYSAQSLLNNKNLPKKSLLSLMEIYAKKALSYKTPQKYNYHCVYKISSNCSATHSIEEIKRDLNNFCPK